MSDRPLEIRPMSPVIGAEIHGLDLSQPVDAEQAERVRRALDEHLVVFFPDQKLTPEQHVAFGRALGTVDEEHPSYLPTLPGRPEIVRLEGQKGGKADVWHSDISWNPEPPMGSILYAQEIPDCGGDTMWANMVAAYEGLSERMKRMLDGAQAVHDLSATAQAILRERQDGHSSPHGWVPTDLPSSTHPVVRTHPRTGRKALYVNRGFTSHIADLSLKESDAILAFLYEHSVQPEYTVRRRWSAGDVAFWDNRCTMHYALADYGYVPRTIHRITLKGERPV